MRLNAQMTSISVMIDLSYEKYVESDGTLVVELDKALYGCVEAAALWLVRGHKREIVDIWICAECVRPLCAQQSGAVWKTNHNCASR